MNSQKSISLQNQAFDWYLTGIIPFVRPSISCYTLVQLIQARFKFYLIYAQPQLKLGVLGSPTERQHADPTARQFPVDHLEAEACKSNEELPVTLTIRILTRTDNRTRVDRYNGSTGPRNGHSADAAIEHLRTSRMMVVASGTTTFIRTRYW